MTTFLHRIRDLSADERPRERLAEHGPRYLSDAELLALLLGAGRRGASALDVSRELLRALGHDLHRLAELSLSDLQRHAGIGPARATRLVAALELGRRRQGTPRNQHPRLLDSNDCFLLLRPRLADLPHEEFHLLCLDNANRLLGRHTISRGGTTATVADARTIFRTALGHPRVTGLVLAHNHPSGEARPSQADVRLTEKLARAARDLDLGILDHIIVAGEAYFSFADKGYLRPPEST